MQHDVEFDRDLALNVPDPDRPLSYAGVFSDRWYIDRALNGGHVIAAVVRGLEKAVDDPGRAPRSVTVHFVAPAAAAPFDLDVTIDRSGRSLTNARAVISQGGKVVASALGALGGAWDSYEWDDRRMPQVPSPEDCETIWPDGPMMNFHERWFYGGAIGPDGSRRGNGAHVSGGWLRLQQARPVDAALAAALCDSWVPVPFNAVDQPLICPTIDLTVNFTRPLPVAGDDGSQPSLIAFSAPHSIGGYFVQDAELWSRDGLLLAVARQQALLIRPTNR